MEQIAESFENNLSKEYEIGKRDIQDSSTDSGQKNSKTMLVQNSS